MKKKGRNIFVLFITLVLTALAVQSYMTEGLVKSWAEELSRSSEKTKIYFAVVIPGAENYDKVSSDIVRGVELCLAEQNRSSSEYEFHMTVIDEQSADLMQTYGDDTTARVSEVASRIVSPTYSDYYEDPAPLAVLGHWTSGRSSTAGEIYKGNIVAITGTALVDDITATNPWYYRTVFNNASQADFLAEFIYKSLGYERIYVVGQEPDKYSEELTQQFVDHYTGLGGEIATPPLILDMDDDPEERYKRVIDLLAIQKIDGANMPIALLLQVNEAREFASRLKLESKRQPTLNKYIFVGSDSASSVDYANPEMATYGSKVPNYADGTISVSPIIYDVAGYAAQDFLRNIKAHTGEEDYNPSWRAVTFYEGACALAEAVKDSRISGDPSQLARERESIRDVLAGYNSPESAVPGIIGPIYFDENRNITHPIMLGRFRNGQLISYFHQYNATDPRHTGDLRVGNIPLKEVNVSYAGIELIEIKNLDLAGGSFSADFYLWFLHNDPTVDDRDVEFVNAKSPIQLGEPLESIQVGDLYYRLYRTKGEFRGEFDFRNYPFDAQSISIQLRNARKTYQDLIYVVDVVGVDTENIVDKLKEANTFSSLYGWNLDEATLYQQVISNKSALGNPAKIGQNNNREFSVITYQIDFKRDTLNFAIKNMLPGLLAVIVTYISFFLSLQQINTTRTVVTGSLLTVALMHSGLARNLPSVDYLTMLDILFYIAYFVIFVEVGITILAQRAYEAEDFPKAKRLIFYGRIFFPFIILIGMIVAASLL